MSDDWERVERNGDGSIVVRCSNNGKKYRVKFNAAGQCLSIWVRFARKPRYWKDAPEHARRSVTREVWTREHGDISPTGARVVSTARDLLMKAAK